MILEGVMMTLVVLGALNLLGLGAMVQAGGAMTEGESAVATTFAVQAVVFLLIGFTMMATLAATGPTN